MNPRVVGVDVARCLALLGMMATHVLPGVVDGEVPLAQQVAGGRASALFAVLAGVSLTFVAGERGPLRGRPWTAMLAGTTMRAALLVLVGLLLGELGSGIAVILVYYAVLFVICVPFLALSTPSLVAVGIGWVAVAPQLSHLLRSRLATTSYDVPTFGSLADPVELGRDLLLTGYYPAFTWVAYVVVGIAIGRLDLRAGRTAGMLALLGAAAVGLGWAVSELLLARPDVRPALIRSFSGAGWQGDLGTTLAHGLYGVTPTESAWWLAVRAPHTGTSPDLLVTIGSACLVLAGCLLLGRWAPRLWAIVFGAGAMTLTLYTLHVVLRSKGAWDGDGTGTFLGQALLVLAIGAVYRWAGRRGPLEFFVGEVSSGVRRLVAGRR